MIKICDYSNSSERPKHRSNYFGATKENSIVSILKKYAGKFDACFVDSLSKADVIFTNDIFPKEALECDKPKVKRMDGIYWLKELADRNEPLNRAAQVADKVIFISEYSRKSYYELYGKKLKSDIVVVNCEDPEVCQPSIKRVFRKPFASVFVASATSWARPEKRFQSILNLSYYVQKLILIGELPKNLVLPENVESYGALDRNRIASILRSVDAFVNFSYRDACPKVVSEAVMSGLPVFYANSGGTGEMVNAGLSIEDKALWNFEDSIPELCELEIVKRLKRFQEEFPELWIKAGRIPKRFDRMLEKYFDCFREVLR